MVQKWIVGMLGAFAVLAMVGVGFSAFTATATVNGSASAGTVGVAIVAESSAPATCFYLPDTPYGGSAAPGSVLLNVPTALSSVATFTAANLTPGVGCDAYITIENTGSVPENISIALSTAGANGVCASTDQNCFDVISQSGIEAASGYYFGGSPTGAGPASVSTNFVTLAPGATYADAVAVLIATGSTSAPASATFTLTYTASAGI